MNEKTATTVTTQAACGARAAADEPAPTKVTKPVSKGTRAALRVLHRR